MNGKARGCVAGQAVKPRPEERLREGLLALIALDLVAFACAAMLALIVPDAFDTAARSANESALAFSAFPSSIATPDGSMQIAVVPLR
jgi:hypothetical protein